MDSDAYGCAFRDAGGVKVEGIDVGSGVGGVPAKCRVRRALSLLG